MHAAALLPPSPHVLTRKLPLDLINCWSYLYIYIFSPPCLYIFICKSRITLLRHVFRTFHFCCDMMLHFQVCVQSSRNGYQPPSNDKIANQSRMMVNLSLILIFWWYFQNYLNNMRRTDQVLARKQNVFDICVTKKPVKIKYVRRRIMS